MSIDGCPNTDAPFVVTTFVRIVLGSFAFALSSPATSAIERESSGKKSFSTALGREFKAIVE
jgi:hypothetical protein